MKRIASIDFLLSNSFYVIEGAEIVVGVMKEKGKTGYVVTI